MGGEGKGRRDGEGWEREARGGWGGRDGRGRAEGQGGEEDGRGGGREMRGGWEGQGKGEGDPLDKSSMLAGLG